MRWNLGGLLAPLFILLLCDCNIVAGYAKLANDTLKNLDYPGKDFDIKTGALLSPILQTRVPGTPGSDKVIEHFANFFKKSLPKWKLEFQNSTSKTPVTGNKDVPFRNLILTRDPPWSKVGEVGRLVLVAHYDSKLEPEGFIGATDSAAPCAMLMHVARSIDDALTKKWSSMKGVGLDSPGLEADQGIQILLLDGEEAFAQWTDTDSIYGARSLADEWEHTFHPAMSTYRTALSSIQLFVLLDLLGAKDPKIPSYFKTTHWAYEAMADLEARLRSLRRFKSSPNHPSKRSSENSHDLDLKPRAEPLFLPDAGKTDAAFRVSYVGDDHVPFMHRGVSILHLIPTPFPGVWHKMEDDGEHLDMDTVEDWTILMTAFAAEWMELDDFLGMESAFGKRGPSGKTEL